MKNIYSIMINTFLQLFRKRMNVVVYIVLPVVIISLFFSITASTKVNSFNMAVIDNDQSVISQDMMKYLYSTNKFKHHNIESLDYKELIIERALDFVIIIPENFERSIIEGINKNVEVISVQGQQSTIFVKQYINMFLNNVSKIPLVTNGDFNLFYSIYNNYKQGQYKFEANEVEDLTSSKRSTEMSMGIFILIIMMSCSTTANLLLKEKKQGTFARICTAPVKSREIVLANILVNVLISLLQVSIVIFVTTQVFNLRFFIKPLYLFAILAAFSLAAVGIGLLIMVFSDSSRMASTLMNFVLTPSCMIAGCFWPRSIMPSFLQRVSYFIPQSWAMDAITRLQNGTEFGTVIINILAILLFALVFFLIATYKISSTDETNQFI